MSVDDVERGADLAIRVSALRKSYPGGIVALDGVDLAVPKGTLAAILGANGSGKSTLLKIAAGVIAADAGSVQVLGSYWAHAPGLLRKRTGYVAQSAELDVEMTGAETLRLFASLFGISPAVAGERIDSFAEILGLREHLPRLVGAYSGGLRQRLHLALGLLHEPELLLLDEPTAALDPAGRAILWQIARQHRDRGRSALIVSHDPPEAARYCDQVVLMYRGRVAAVGAAEELIARHGAWTLEIELARSLAAGDLDAMSGGLPAVAPRAATRAGRLVLPLRVTDLHAALATRDAVVAHLTAAGETVLGHHLEAPDLGSVYFKLTAEAIDTSDESAQRGAGVGGAGMSGVGKGGKGPGRGAGRAVGRGIGHGAGRDGAAGAGIGSGAADRVDKRGGTR